MPGTPRTVCPYSGTTDEDDAFVHPDDVAAAKELVAHAARADVAEVVHGMFANLGRRHSHSKFLQVQVGPKSPPKPKPRFARRDLLRELVCDECGRDYGVYAISLYCPDCGAPNIHLHFAREATLVREQVGLAATLDDAQQELAYRLLGNAHEDVLTAFEATLKTVYLHKVALGPANTNGIKPVNNAFQNIERARQRFAEFEFDPFGALVPDTLAVLTLNIQKRHVIGHNLGIADAGFAKDAAEARLGETVSLVGDDILQFAEICQMVVDHVDGCLAGGVLPSLADRPVPPTKAPVTEQTELQIGELGPFAARIGVWIASHSENGFDDHVGEHDLRQAFPEESLDDFAFAVAELDRDGYLSTTPLLSGRIPQIRTTLQLYLTFDPHAVKHDPAIDVIELVDRALSEDSMGSAEKLHIATGWSLRRFNPAFAYMLSHIDDRRIAGRGVPDYPAGAFFMSDGERVDLKRFAARLRR